MATPGPRNNQLQDDQYFMSVAILAAMKSSDPNTQVGACIVKDGKVISVGYNHMPRGDDKHDWNKSGPDHKYFYVCFAVKHAIMNAWGLDLNGAHLYTTMFPSNNCAIDILLTGITKVFYLTDPHAEKNWCKASKKMLNERVIHFSKIEVEDSIISQPMRDGNPYYIDLK